MRKDKLNMIKNILAHEITHVNNYLLPPEKLLKIVRHRCIPCIGKTPPYKLKFKNKPASTNKQLEFWFGKYNTKSWLTRTGDLDLNDGFLIVLDIDNPKLVNPGYNPSPYYVKTLKGPHWYFWVKEETGLKSTHVDNEFGERVGDIKAHKNVCVVAPYSQHKINPNIFYEPSPALIALDLSRNLPDVLSKDELLNRLREYLGFCPLELQRRKRHSPFTSIDHTSSKECNNESVNSNSEFGISNRQKAYC